MATAVATGMLLPEIVERVCSHLAPIERSEYFMDPCLLHKKDLQSASLVCRAWREPAQRLLLGILDCSSVQSVNRYLDRVASHGANGGMARVLLLKSWEGAEAGATEAVLDLLGRSKAITELQIVNAIGLDDKAVLDMLSLTPGLRHLVLGCEPYYCEDGDDDPLYDITRTLRWALPRQQNLTQLHLYGLMHDNADTDMTSLPMLSLPELKQLAIVECSFDFDVITWLYRATTTSLRNLSISTSEDVTDSQAHLCFDRDMSHLRVLNFFRENAAPACNGTPARHLLSLCPNVHTLGIEEKNLQAASLAHMHKLHRLYAIVDRRMPFLVGLVRTDLPVLDLVEVASKTEDDTTDNDSLLHAEAGAAAWSQFTASTGRMYLKFVQEAFAKGMPNVGI